MLTNHFRKFPVQLLGAILLLLLSSLQQVSAAPGALKRISMTSGGFEGSDSYAPALSGDGRYVAFWSYFSNLVANDTNGERDVFVYDRDLDTTTRVSVATDGTQGDRSSSSPDMTSDGNRIAFVSSATNLVTGDTNHQSDVFVHDRGAGTTTRVSVASDGTQGNGSNGGLAISDNGRYVAFSSSSNNLVGNDTNNYNDIFRHDTQTGTTIRVSVATDGTQADGPSYAPAISTDGRYIAFNTWASTLVPNDTNGRDDIFVHDTQTGTTTRISEASDGTQGNIGSYDPSMSSDGRYVAFVSLASNLVDNDTNGESDIFIYDQQTGEIKLVSVAVDGTLGNGRSNEHELSSDGNYVAFKSNANNLVPGDTNGYGDIYVRALQTGEVRRASILSNGTQLNGTAEGTAISGDGRFVAFQTSATNLVANDLNESWDIFVAENILSPNLDIDLSALSWLNDNPGCLYNVYHNTSPYTGHTLLQGSMNALTFSINSYVGDPMINHYFYIEVTCSGVTAFSNEVGEFDFLLKPGA